MTRTEGRATSGSLVGQGDSATHERVRRPLYMALGCLCVAVGVLGMVVPLLPTTCFLLAGSWLFARSSPRCERWMFENRLFGAYLYEYRQNRVVPRPLKWGSIAVLWAGLMVSSVFVGSPAGRLLLLLVGVAVTIHVARLHDAVGGGEVIAHTS